MVDVHRFQDQIDQLLQYPVERGKVLFYGSSFFHQWGYERARNQCAQIAGMDILNHGFGGATVEELLYHYHRLVLPYQPSAVVFRIGHNDVWLHSAQDAMLLTKHLLGWVKQDFPGIPLILLKTFDHPSALEENLVKLHRYNELLDVLAGEDPLVTTVDLNPFFRKEKAEEIFREDGLHLTDVGYEKMAFFLAPKLRSILV